MYYGNWMTRITAYLTEEDVNMETPTVRKKVWKGGIEKVPPALAVCPECGGTIQVEVKELYQGENGSWYATSTGIYLSCRNDESDPNNIVPHYQQPYLDWLPLEQRILDWLNRNFCFDPS